MSNHPIHDAIHFTSLLSQLALLTGFIILMSLLLFAVGFNRSIQISETTEKKSSILLKFKLFWGQYIQTIQFIYRGISSSGPMVTHISLVLISALNFGLLFLFPFSPKFNGLDMNHSYLLVVLVILLNTIGSSASFSEQNRASIADQRFIRILFSTILVIVCASMSVSLFFHTTGIQSIIQFQQDKLFLVLPAWSGLRSPILFLNAFIFLVYLLLLLQLFNDSDFHLNRFKHIWTFSFLLLLIMVYITLFWGAYLSPVVSKYDIMKMGPSIFWFALKIILILSLLRHLFQRLPVLVEEQFLKLTYGLVFPIQIISLILIIILNVYQHKV